MGLGELPPVALSADWAIVPVEIYKALPASFFPNNTSQLGWWTLTVAGAKVGSPGKNESNLTTPFQAYVDTGNPFSLLPHDTAVAADAAFRPSATPVYGSPGLYCVAYNATAPEFGIVIGNQTFYHNGSDMIQPDLSESGICFSTVMNGSQNTVEGVEPLVLETPFLRNVVGVFNMDNATVSFAARSGGGTSNITTSGRLPPIVGTNSTRTGPTPS